MLCEKICKYIDTEQLMIKNWIIYNIYPYCWYYTHVGKLALMFFSVSLLQNTFQVDINVMFVTIGICQQLSPRVNIDYFDNLKQENNHLFTSVWG